MTFPTLAEAHDFIKHVNLMDADVIPIQTTHGHWVVTSPTVLRRPANVCSICGEAFHEYPNNPRPVAEGICCAYCDDHVVTPARIERMESAS